MLKHFKKTFIFFISLALITSVMVGVVACNDSTPSDGVEGAAEIALTIIKGSETRSYTLAEIKAMQYQEGWGGIMNSSGFISGPFRQKGVVLVDLLDEVGGINSGDAIRMTAKDGYSMTYSYGQIANSEFTTLDCSTGAEVPHGDLTTIVCYEEDGGCPN